MTFLDSIIPLYGDIRERRKAAGHERKDYTI